MHDEMQILFYLIFLLLFQNDLNQKSHSISFLQISMKFKSTLLSHLIQQSELISL